MCFDPLSIGSLSTLASLAGTGISAVGQMQAGKAQAASYEFKAKQDRLLAEDALARGEESAQAQRRKNEQLLGRQKAVMAASNLDLGSGSPLQILGDTAQLGELDVERIKGNTAREAQSLTSSAQMSDAAAENAQNAGMISGFGTILGGAATLADKWYKPAPRTYNSGPLGGI